ncbi:2-hydroxyacyl-CoA dehydratase subunit D [Chloroflexota bacterium]
MTKYGKYETRPLDCWPKYIEAINKHWQDVWEAKDKGKTLIFRSGEFAHSLTAGLPDKADFQEAPYSQTIAVNRELATELSDALETMGYRDICGAMGLPLAAILTGRAPHGKLPKPDFVLTFQVCEVEGKIGQIAAEHYDIPHFFVEAPKPVRGAKRQQHLKYLTSQIHDAIEWMEKVSGKEWDDEKFIEGVRNEWQTYALWSKIIQLNQCIPAPLSQRHIGLLLFPAVAAGDRKWVVDLFKMGYDEIKDRVDKGIAAVANERCRLLHEGIPPSYFLSMFRIAEQYGVVFLGSELYFGLCGAFSASTDGSWVASETPEEQGIELRTRDNAVEALADIYLHNIPFLDDLVLATRVDDLLKRVQDWHADGVVMHFDHGCHGVPSGMPDCKLALDRCGIPNMTYESSNCDPRHFSEAQVVERLKAFFEAMGLTRLTEEKASIS